MAENVERRLPAVTANAACLMKQHARLENGQKGKYAVDKSARISNEELLAIHCQRRNKQLRCRNTAPDNADDRQSRSQHSPAIVKHPQLSQIKPNRLKST